MLILNIETSTTVCSVTLSDNEKIISEKISYEPNSHSRLLAGFIENIFKENKIEPSSIDAVAVSEGPGSYTGLRIGVSTAKGIAYSLNKPMIAVDTLQIMTLRAIEQNPELANEQTFFCPMIDARRMEVYSAFYDFEANKISETTNIIIDEHSFLTPLHKKRIVFFGDGAEKCKTIITHENAIFTDEIFPLSTNMVNISMEYYKQNKFVDVAYFEPFYLKPFIATTPKNKFI
ncbi:MAG: tRNA (adenosine(37)-N6)-threonylcarbamoyltransferase complex dimerization subunit type 1 TsaB [Bacteroidales bacterium]|nr:tRNA (adenosine(37)-N6)-threonylcarbamoyltransferase complex dimerization subunit type 1 TsaB [Bacteroidales bacterium]